MNRILLVISCYLAGIVGARAQQPVLTLQKAYDLAQQNYPLIRQRDLIRQTTGLSLDNLRKGFLPQISFSGQASYQSAVTQVKVPIPGITIEPPNKDQYRLLADVSQLIYDGGTIRLQQNIQQLNSDAENQQVEVELYRLKERINQFFLGVLFLDEQLKQAALIKKDLQTGIKRVQAQVDNGVAFRSNLDLLRAEELKADQRVIELQSSRKGLLDVMSIFINQPLTENTKLETPAPEPVQVTGDIQRPELKLYSTREKLLGGQFALVDAKLRPKASLFWQGGYGRPGLNMLKNEFDFFYTAGLRFSWSLGSLYTRKQDKKIIELNQQNIGLQKEVFLLNTNTQLKQQEAELNKLQQLVTTDAEIIGLREKVKEAARAQLENGVITANDYLREVNAEDQARQSLITHRVQLLQAQIGYQTIAGKQ